MRKRIPATKQWYVFSTILHDTYYVFEVPEFSSFNWWETISVLQEGIRQYDY